jgi:hypothetical protein
MSKTDLLTKSEFASTFGISRSYLHNLLKRGAGPRVVRFDRSREYIPASELVAWPERHVTEAGGAGQTEARAA